MKPKRKIEPWLFLLPALVVYVSIVLFPMLQTIGYSFMDWNGIGEKTFAGLKNYSRMLSDKKAIGLRCISFISAGITPSG